VVLGIRPRSLDFGQHRSCAARVQIPGDVDILVGCADLAGGFDQRSAPIDAGERDCLRPARHARAGDQRGAAGNKATASEFAHGCDLLLLDSARPNRAVETLNPRSWAIRLRSGSGLARSTSSPSCRIVEILLASARTPMSISGS